MDTLRQRISLLILCSTLFAACASAQSTLTHIQDTVYTPSGSLFNGTVVVTWTGSANSTGNTPAPSNTSVKIYNGALSVLLVPSTTATPPAYYQAAFSSSDGLVTWTETWQVPPSSTPLTLSEVRVPNGSVTTGGGGTGSSGPVTIAQVTGLSTYLSTLNNSIVTLTALLNTMTANITSINNSIANLTTQVNSVTAGTTSAAFADDETPGGLVDGNNGSFTLANTPTVASSLYLFRNGVLQQNGLDYTLTGGAITFLRDIPQAGDNLVAYYRLSGTGPAVSFVDGEIPQGPIDGSNMNFALSETPNPAFSLKLYKNGLLMQQNGDYTLSGAQITFTSQRTTPQPGDMLTAYYRVNLSTVQPQGIFPNRGVAAPARQGR